MVGKKWSIIKSMGKRGGMKWECHRKLINEQNLEIRIPSDQSIAKDMVSKRIENLTGKVHNLKKFLQIIVEEGESHQNQFTLTSSCS